jgi:excisionase family DNA binding protein
VSESFVSGLLDLLAPEIERMVDERIATLLAGLRTPEPQVWLTTSEAAGRLRLSPEALRARARRGTVPAHRDGRRYLFRRDELDCAIDGYHPGPNQPEGPAQRELPGPWLQGGTP